MPGPEKRDLDYREFVEAALLRSEDNGFPHVGAMRVIFMLSRVASLITYDLDAQEFAQDFGSHSGTVPDVSCAQGCSQLSAPQGTTATCDQGTSRCVLVADVRLPVTINLAAQKNFPSQVANSSVISSVKVNAVSYWAASNTLSVATPPIDIYVGSQTVQKETDAGATRLGTLPSLPASRSPSCKSGAAGTRESACQLELTSDGKNVLGRLAKDYRNPFNVLVVARLVLRGGSPLPSGKLDLFVQPQIAFGIGQ